MPPKVWPDWLEAVREASRRSVRFGNKHRVQRLKAGGYRVVWTYKRTDWETMYRRHLKRCRYGPRGPR